MNELKLHSDDDFYDGLEKLLEFRIPVLVKNILKVNYFTSAYTFTNFSEKSVEDIENYMRIDFNKSIVPDGEHLKDYLGNYCNSQENFKLIGGQIQIISNIARECRKLYDDNPTTLPPNSFENEGSLCGEEVQRIISDDRRNFFNLICSHIITVFNDAKHITLSSWSWPGRYATSEFALSFRNNGHSSTDINLQYVTPANHAEFLDCIVQSNLEDFRTIIKESLAISLRVDGSTDRTTEHNVFVMANIVKCDATTSTVFLGFHTPKTGKSFDYFECVKKVVGDIIPWPQFLEMVTSLVTDGEYLNTGDFNGLFRKIRTERSLSVRPELPLFVIWCIGHRVNLAWKVVSKINIIQKLILSARKLAAHFRKSGKRTKSLKTIAAANEFHKPLRYPAYFEVRWSEFTYNLFNAVLRNWRSSIKYFESTNFHTLQNHWQNVNRLHLMTFLIDVLGLLKSFQKTCQSDSISLLDVVEKKRNLLEKLENCKHDALEQGWEELFLKNLTATGNKFHLCGIRLKKANRGVNCSLSSTTRDFLLVKLIGQLRIRLGIDEAFQQTLEPLTDIKSTVSSSNLQQCYSFLLPDCEEETFYAEYREAAALLTRYECKTTHASLQKLHELRPNDMTVMKRGLARVVAAKPHSADVERLINVYNKFEDPGRSSLGPKSLFNKLYANTNMETVEEFDPRPATELWFAKRKRQPNRSSSRRNQNWFKGVFKDAGVEHNRRPKIQF